MGFINSPYMRLPIPNVGNENGPQYATDVNQCLTTIDQHNHGPGSGVPIGSQGINIQSDLSFNIQNATNLRTVRFVATTATSGTDVGCLYMKGVDLYFNDGSANNIRITQSGGLSTSATFIGLIQTTAIVSAAGPTPATSGFIRMNNNTDFVSWRNAANNADNTLYSDSSNNLQYIAPGPVAGVGGGGIQAWNFRFPDAGNNGKVVTVQAPFGTSAYTLTLPPQPSTALAPVFMSSSGSLTTAGQITGNMMAGNNNIPGKFTQVAGAYPVVSNANNATSSLGVIRGKYNGGTNSIISGEGFSMAKVGTGNYTVFFTNSFTDIPVVTSNGEFVNGAFYQINTEGSATSARLHVLDTTLNPADATVHFIVSGQRL